MKMIRRALLALLFVPLLALAALSNQQLQAVKTAILADPALASQPMTSGGALVIAEALNAQAAPDFIVWRTSLARHDILTGTSIEGTTFTWTGGAYITRSQGERDAFREMFNSTGSVNPRTPTIISAFNDIFSGAGGATNRAHIEAVSKRKATRVEKITASGTGSLASPATLSFEGAISGEDVQQARELP